MTEGGSDPNNSQLEVEYLEGILDKHDFITQIYITDYEAINIVSASRDQSEEAEEVGKKLKILLATNFNIIEDQSLKNGKWNTKSIISYYDNHIIHQTKLNKVCYASFICTERYNHEIINALAHELEKKLEKVEKSLEDIKKEIDKEN